LIEKVDSIFKGRTGSNMLHGIIWSRKIFQADNRC